MVHVSWNIISLMNSCEYLGVSSQTKHLSSFVNASNHWSFLFSVFLAVLSWSLIFKNTINCIFFSFPCIFVVSQYKQCTCPSCGTIPGWCFDISSCGTAQYFIHENIHHTYSTSGETGENVNIFHTEVASYSVCLSPSNKSNTAAVQQIFMKLTVRSDCWNADVMPAESPFTSL